jgi:hypothetical protein
MNQDFHRPGSEKKLFITQHSPKINITHNFLIKPHTINEDDINQLTPDFTWANGETTQHNVGNNGHIHIYREEYTNITQTALVTHNTDITTYSLWQFFRTKNQSLADTNYAQSPKQPSVTNIYIPPEPTPLNLNGIPDTLLLYLPYTKVPHPQIPGDSIRIDDVIVRVAGARPNSML